MLHISWMNTNMPPKETYAIMSQGDIARTYRY